MKRWRRTASVGASPAAAPAAPRIITVTAMGGGSYTVVFDAAVTWDGDDSASTFLVGGDVASPELQLSPTSIDFEGSEFPPGTAWNWIGAAPHLTPTPDPTQTGFVA